MNIGILGGTFDPIHHGHLLIASAAYEAFDLDRVLIMPAQTPPHKRGRTITAADDRLAVIQAAIAPDPRLQISRLDLDTDAPSYTADLLERVRAFMPNERIWFVIGEDSLQDFPTWRDPMRILSNTRLAVARRPGYAPQDVQINGRSIAPYIDRFDAPLVDISSTELRTRAASGLPLTWYTPLAAAFEIGRRRLYVGGDQV